MAKEDYRRGQSQRMDENRTCGCAYANHQWVQNRELMSLRHLSTTSIPSLTDHDARGFETNAFPTSRRDDDAAFGTRAEQPSIS
jgi:hypothetical protein